MSPDTRPAVTVVGTMTQEGVMDTQSVRQHQKILASYRRYDADPRVRGPEDYDAYEEALIANPHHRLALVSLLTCMAVDGGPEDCCGCFKGHWCDWDGGFYSFECNECGRQAFAAHEEMQP